MQLYLYTEPGSIQLHDKQCFRCLVTLAPDDEDVFDHLDLDTHAPLAPDVERMRCAILVRAGTLLPLRSGISVPGLVWIALLTHRGSHAEFCGSASCYCIDAACLSFASFALLKPRKSSTHSTERIPPRAGKTKARIWCYCYRTLWTFRLYLTGVRASD